MSDAMTDMRNNKKLRDEIESLRQQLSNRDAEIAELKGANVLNRNALRLQKEKTDQLREQVAMLRDALKNMCMSVLNESGAWAQFNDLYKSAEEALAATESRSTK